MTKIHNIVQHIDNCMKVLITVFMETDTKTLVITF